MSDSIDPISYDQSRFESNKASSNLFQYCRELTRKVVSFSKETPEANSLPYIEEKKSIKSDVSEIKKLIVKNPGKFPGLEPLFATYTSDLEDFLKDPKAGLGNLTYSQNSLIEWMTEFITKR